MVTTRSSDEAAARDAEELERLYATLERQRVENRQFLAGEAQALREEIRVSLNAMGQDIESTGAETRDLLEEVRGQMRDLLHLVNVLRLS